MIRIKIKPLSQNESFQGGKVKTSKYRVYEKTLKYILPKLEIPIGKLRIDYVFGFSSRGADLDNPTKSFQDILSKKYGFNDNRIYEIFMVKKIVKKGDEYVEFKITSLENTLEL